MQVSFIMRALLAMALCLAALPATAQVGPNFDPSVPIRVVYRVEFAQPLNVFTSGFAARGINEDLLALTSGAPCFGQPGLLGPAWVGMTVDREQAVLFARRALEGMPRSGRTYPIHLFAIRADQDFVSVPGAFWSAIDAGRDDRAGYSPEHANALEYMLYTRPILGEQMVVASRVYPHAIMHATPLWLENGNLVEGGNTIANAGYIHDGTSSATRVVPDWRLPRLFPPYEVLQSTAGATGTCAMSCDRATSASSFSSFGTIDYDRQCAVSDALSPLLHDLINDD